MRVNRSPHKRNFTILPNQILQGSGLRNGPRGLLCFLLSLPDNQWMPAEEMARRSRDTLTSVRRWLHELTEAGYYIVRPVQIAKGHIISVQHVTDVPWQFPSLQVAPIAGKPESGRGGPLKTKERKQETPLPPFPPEPPAGGSAKGSAGGPAEPPAIPRQRTRTAPRPPATRPAPSPAPAAAAAAAPVLDDRTRIAADTLLRVVRHEPRLRIGEAEAVRLAPLVAGWFDRGSNPADLAAALLPGLPEHVHSPAGFLYSRLTDKVPAAFAPAAPAPTCDTCHDPVPRPGRCHRCTQAPPPAPVAPGTGAALAREALHRARAARC
ncbi:helix-turn-helix domain-containing protein [Kitasatospora sp. NPDC057198]|uniref:helix-turn-helix domain-containing protein n=1 Tax=Kitasatospora sp. NPDC057198 TaxID=3346046 RepID=UPI003639195A